MTRHSFAEAVETLEPLTLHASHYSLADDAYGLADGYEWAFSTVAQGEHVANADADPNHNDPATGLPAANASTYHARHPLTDGGEWPYYIAAIPSPALARADRYAVAGALREDSPHRDKITPEDAAAAVKEGRVLETYGEGDLTAYIFETKHDRDTVARAWQETGGEYAARVLEDDHGYTASAAESLGAAVAECWADRSGQGRDHADAITRDDITETMEFYAGEYATEAEWAEARFEEYADSAREALEATSLPDEVVSRMLSVNWEGVAFDMGANGSGVTIYNGHAFRDN